MINMLVNVELNFILMLAAQSIMNIWGWQIARARRVTNPLELNIRMKIIIIAKFRMMLA
jgi:hypothetical protein